MHPSCFIISLSAFHLVQVLLAVIAIGTLEIEEIHRDPAVRWAGIDTGSTENTIPVSTFLFAVIASCICGGAAFLFMLYNLMAYKLYWKKSKIAHTLVIVFTFLFAILAAVASFYMDKDLQAFCNRTNEPDKCDSLLSQAGKNIDVIYSGIGADAVLSFTFVVYGIVEMVRYHQQHRAPKQWYPINSV